MEEQKKRLIVYLSDSDNDEIPRDTLINSLCDEIDSTQECIDSNSKRYDKAKHMPITSEEDYATSECKMERCREREKELLIKLYHLKIRFLKSYNSKKS